MSGFTPIRTAAAFHAGLAGEVGREPSVQPSASSVADNSAADEGAAPEEGAATLPSTLEELEALLDEARQEARAESEAAVAEVQMAAKAQRDELDDIINRVESARLNWSAEVRSLLGELVMVGVRTVVSESVDLQEAMLRDRFAEVGERLVGERQVVVHVRPQDVDTARQILGDREGWQVVPSEEISGGLVAETEGGKIDASMGSALTGLAESVQSWQAEGEE